MSTQKAIDFATICLGYKDARAECAVICDGSSSRCFNIDSITDLQRVLEEFLGDRYWIQINRDMGGIFKWSVIVGQQNLVDKRACFDHGKGVGDIAEAIFDACITAKAMDRRAS